MEKYEKNLWYLSYYGRIGLQILQKLTDRPEGIDYSVPEKYKSILEDVVKDYDLFAEEIGESTAEFVVERKWSTFKFWKKVTYITSIHGLDSIYNKDIKEAGSLKIITYSICKTKEELIEREKER